MSLKKSELREIEKERDRFMTIMEMTLKHLNEKRQSKFERILNECPDVECAREAMGSYTAVNNEVDKLLDKFSEELYTCVQTEK